MKPFYKSWTIWFAVLKVLLGLTVYYLNWIDIALLDVILGEAVISAGLRAKTKETIRLKKNA